MSDSILFIAGWHCCRQPSFPQKPSLSFMPYENPQLGVRVSIRSDSQIVKETPNEVTFVSAMSSITSDPQLSTSIIRSGKSMLSNNPAIYTTMSSPQTGYSVSTTTLVNGIFFATICCN